LRQQVLGSDPEFSGGKPLQLISESLAGLRLGAPQVHLNLALIPLLSSPSIEHDRAPGYLLLDEALERKLARVREVPLKAACAAARHPARGAGRGVVTVGHRYRRVARD
jgi:hypothetical protein